MSRSSSSSWTNSITVVFQCCGRAFTHRDRNITDIGLLVDLCSCEGGDVEKNGVTTSNTRNLLVLGACDNEHYPRSFNVYARPSEPEMMKKPKWDLTTLTGCGLRMSECRLRLSQFVDRDASLPWTVDNRQYDLLRFSRSDTAPVPCGLAWNESATFTLGDLRRYCEDLDNVNAATVSVTLLKPGLGVQILVTSDIRDWRHCERHTMALLLIHSPPPHLVKIVDCYSNDPEDPVEIEDDADGVAHEFADRDNESVDALLTMYENRCLLEDKDMLHFVHFDRSMEKQRDDALFWIDEEFRKRVQDAAITFWYMRRKYDESVWSNKGEYYAAFPCKTFGEPYAVILNVTAVKHIVTMPMYRRE